MIADPKFDLKEVGVNVNTYVKLLGECNRIDLTKHRNKDKL